MGLVAVFNLYLHLLRSKMKQQTCVTEVESYQ